MIKHLKLTNYGQFSKRSFDLKRGINGIIGPNGSGKSTLTSAVYMLLTGDVPDTKISRKTKNDMLRIGAEKGTVEGILSNDATVIRHLHKSYNVLHLPSNSKKLTRASEINEYMEDLLGTDLSFLQRISVSLQMESVKVLFSGEINDRIKFFLSLFGEPDYDMHREAVRKESSKLATILSEDTDNLKAHYKGDLQSYESDLAAISEARKENEKYILENKEKAQMYKNKDLSRTKEEYDEQIRDLEISREHVLEQYERLTEEVNKYQDNLGDDESGPDYEGYERYLELQSTKKEAARIRKQLDTFDNSLEPDMYNIHTDLFDYVWRKSLSNGECLVCGEVIHPDDEADEYSPATESELSDIVSRFPIGAQRKKESMERDLQRLSKKISKLANGLDFDLDKYNDDLAKEKEFKQTLKIYHEKIELRHRKKEELLETRHKLDQLKDSREKALTGEEYKKAQDFVITWKEQKEAYIKNQATEKQLNKSIIKAKEALKKVKQREEELKELLKTKETLDQHRSL